MWSQLEPTSAHLTYLVLSSFLIIYALFSAFIRNRLHLSEPPLATLLGIVFGPYGAKVLNPLQWGFEDNITQEATRVIVGVQVFAVGVELPSAYLARHWKSVCMMLGPVMIFGWIVTAAFIYWLLQTDIPTALTIAACLTPTDPVLAASVLSNSQFSNRVPHRIRRMLSAESGCNDGVSFPFLYAGLYPVVKASTGGAVKAWFLECILYQCIFGLFLGVFIGFIANRALRFSDDRKYIGSPSFFVFYFLLALFAVGVGSTLGADDFLVAFGAGTGFAWDGWFASKTHETHLPNILDLLLNSSMFVYFGASIPWDQFVTRPDAPHLGPGRLIGLLVLILLFRRIPVVLALKRFVPDIRTYREALFAGHFGPMGLGALFLVIEARAQLETGTSRPLPHPPADSAHKSAIEIIWPVVCFIVLGSIMVHGLSTAGISVASHYSRKEGERASLIGAETQALCGMVHGEDDAESGPSISEEEDPDPDPDSE